MIRSISESPLYPIVNPKSIAFFGASNTFMRMGSIMLSSLQALGFEGEIFPIHPTEKVVRGLAAYTTIMDVPKVPDLAVIVLPTEIVCQTLDDCGKKGIRHAIVGSGGFREAGPEGALLQKELADVLGYTPIHINRAVRDLRHAGLIRWVGAEIELLDWDGLVRLARFDPTYLGLDRSRR